MTISELVRELEAYRVQAGDVEVRISCEPIRGVQFEEAYTELGETFPAFVDLDGSR